MTARNSMGMRAVEMIPASENKTALMALIKNQLPSATIYLSVESACLVSRVISAFISGCICTTYPTGCRNPTLIFGISES